MLSLDNKNLSINQLMEKYNIAKEEWNYVITNGRKIQEEELLNKYSINIDSADEKAQSKRKKIINKIKQSKYRKWSFKYLTKNIGRGENKSLTSIQIKDKSGKVTKCIYNRKEIEDEIITFNKSHYKKAYKSKAFTDKIYPKLTNNKTREKVLRRLLTDDDCDYPKVLKFLHLLKQQNPKEYKYQ